MVGLLRRFEPASHGHFLLRVELDRLGPLDMQIAEKRTVPAGERKPGHRRGYADVFADHSGVEVVLELSGRRDAKCRMYRFGIVPKPE
jgi:folate-dependent tRNA-U54 methylase TrmFO/GidA